MLPPYNEWNILPLPTFINRLDYVTFKIERKWDYDELYSKSEEQTVVYLLYN